MPRMISLGRGGAVDMDRVIAIAPFKSKPIKRLLDAAGSGKVVNMTYGYPCHTVILVDGGYLVVTSLTMSELMRVLPAGGEELLTDDNPLSQW